MSLWDRLIRWVTTPGEACPKCNEVDRFGRNRGHLWDYPYGEVTCTLCGLHSYVEYGR